MSYMVAYYIGIYCMQATIATRWRRGAPPPNERRIWSSENLKRAAALKLVNTVTVYKQQNKTKY
jgi:hypothetical protein